MSLTRFCVALFPAIGLILGPAASGATAPKSVPSNLVGTKTHTKKLGTPKTAPAAALARGAKSSSRSGTVHAKGTSLSANAVCFQPPQNCQSRDNFDARVSNRAQFIVAEDFRPTVSGSITGLCWWGGYGRDLGGGNFQDCQGENPDTFEVRYYDDNNGIPGTLLGEFIQGGIRATLTLSPPQATGQMIAGVINEVAFSASHAAVPVTAGVRYWVEITNFPAADCLWFWEIASQGNTQAVQDGRSTPPTPPDGFDPSDLVSDDLALCLNLPLDIGPPADDNCSSPAMINGEGTFPFDILSSTTDGLAPSECFPGFNNQIENDVWQCWTSPCTGKVFVRTCGLTSVDTMIAVYDGCTLCPPTDAELLTCNDDRCVDFTNINVFVSGQSMATFDAVAGRQYLIRLGRFSGTPRGTGMFEITCGPPPLPPTGSCAGGGDCCTTNLGVPGCNDSTCCATVCACNPLCCIDGWVSDCAQTGFSDVNGISGCGAQLLCPTLCPVCGTATATGDCCTANGTLGCADATCCQTVCDADPTCCEIGWDSVCATEATMLCPTACPCGNPSSGDCCGANGTPGCNDTTCCMNVCACDPTCCGANGWDADCVANNSRVPGCDAATLCSGPPLWCSICGDPTAGDCCSDTVTPGCASRDCCRAVCNADSFCCSVFWDVANCVSALSTNLGARCLCPGLCGSICPAATISFVDGVDAGQPTAVDDVNLKEGITSVTVTATADISNTFCWTLCETVVDGVANVVTSVDPNPDGSFTLNLLRPMTSNAVTTLTYQDDCLIETKGRFVSHPANVNGDGFADGADVTRLTDCLRGVRSCTLHQCDIDHNGECTAVDILREIDLLGGGAVFSAWLNTPLPPGTACP